MACVKTWYVLYASAQAIAVDGGRGLRGRNPCPPTRDFPLLGDGFCCHKLHSWVLCRDRKLWRSVRVFCKIYLGVWQAAPLKTAFEYFSMPADQLVLVTFIPIW